MPIQVKFRLNFYKTNKHINKTSLRFIKETFETEMEYDLWFEKFRSNIKPNHQVSDFYYEIIN